jgi:DNA-binding MarR family transcriptional regulator
LPASNYRPGTDKHAPAYNRKHSAQGDRTTPTSPTLFDTETTARVRAVIGRLSRHLRPTAAGTAAGLTPTKTSILLAVVREGPVRLSTIAEAEGVNPTMLSRVIGHLADLGLVERTSDEADRRAAWLRATPAGQELVGRIRRERTDALNAALANLTRTERDQIEAALPALERLADQLRGRRR